LSANPTNLNIAPKLEEKLAQSLWTKAPERGESLWTDLLFFESVINHPHFFSMLEAGYTEV